MATEEFKMLTEELLSNYLEIRNTMKDKGYENIVLSFREYLDFYIQYEKEGLSYYDSDESYDDEDLEDSEEESE